MHVNGGPPFAGIDGADVGGARSGRRRCTGSAFGSHVGWHWIWTVLSLFPSRVPQQTRLARLALGAVVTRDRSATPLFSQVERHRRRSRSGTSSSCCRPVAQQTSRRPAGAVLDCRRRRRSLCRRGFPGRHVLRVFPSRCCSAAAAASAPAAAAPAAATPAAAAAPTSLPTPAPTASAAAAAPLPLPLPPPLPRAAAAASAAAAAPPACSHPPRW